MKHVDTDFYKNTNLGLAPFGAAGGTRSAGEQETVDASGDDLCHAIAGYSIPK